MGRAIQMEKDIDILKKDVQELKDILNDILNEVQEDDKKETKKTDTKRSKASSGKSDTRHDDSKSEGWFYSISGQWLYRI